MSGINLTPEIEGHFTTHKTEGVRMILTLSWHDENIINTILLHETFNYKEHTTLWSLQTMEMVDSIRCEPFTHPGGSLTRIS